MWRTAKKDVLDQVYGLAIKFLFCDPTYSEILYEVNVFFLVPDIAQYEQYINFLYLV
jgi:hypothetical protein